mgnify:CR=1 FL=1
MLITNCARRAERLSWVIWAVIGNQKVGVNAFGGSPYQALLEAAHHASPVLSQPSKSRYAACVSCSDSHA